jgi:hypothetical protein
LVSLGMDVVERSLCDAEAMKYELVHGPRRFRIDDIVVYR